MVKKKKSACNVGDLCLIEIRKIEVSKIPWRRGWLPMPVFLPLEFHGQGSLTGYSTWGRQESDTTEQLSLTYVFRLNLYFYTLLTVMIFKIIMPILFLRFLLISFV